MTVVLYGCLAGILLGAVNVAARLAMRRFPNAELGGLVTAAIALPLLVAITAASGAGADDVEAGSASSADAHPVSRSRPGARFTARIRAMSEGGTGMSTTDTGAAVETTLLGQRVRLYDLTQELSQQTQMHPLHPRVEVYQFESHANSQELLGTGFSYHSRLLIMSDHASTHVDALCHFDPDPEAPTIEEMPLDLFCGEAICIDLSHLPPRTGITVEELQRSLAGDGLELREGDIVLLYTGHYERTAGTPGYLTEFPGLEPEAARWLIEQGAKVFGNQAMSVESPTATRSPFTRSAGSSASPTSRTWARSRPWPGGASRSSASR